MMTRKQIQAAFDLTLDLNGTYEDHEYDRNMIDRIRAVQIAGARHGQAGYYPDGDFSSDADWCYGVGAEIKALEEALDIDDGSIHDLYSDAHSAFFRDGTINPGDRDTYSRNSCFTFRFGAYGDTVVSVWSQADHLEDALEMAAEWLAEHEPGHFAEPDYADAARELGVTTPFTNADMAALYDAGEDDLAEQIIQAAECDLTYTESGYLTSYEWTVDESDQAPGHDPSHSGPRHYGPARNADGTRKN